MKVLVVDDEKDLKCCLRKAGIAGDAGALLVKTYQDGLAALQGLGPWDVLLLDHDLGGAKTGYDLLCWFEQAPKERLHLLPARVESISLNPVGSKRIQLLAENLLAWQQLFKERGDLP